MKLSTFTRIWRLPSSFFSKRSTLFSSLYQTAIQTGRWKSSSSGWSSSPPQCSASSSRLCTIHSIVTSALLWCTTWGAVFFWCRKNALVRALTYAFRSRLDYCGITLLIGGFNVTSFYFGFECFPSWRLFYLLVSVALLFGGLFLVRTHRLTAAHQSHYVGSICVDATFCPSIARRACACLCWAAAWAFCPPYSGLSSAPTKITLLCKVCLWPQFHCADPQSTDIFTLYLLFGVGFFFYRKQPEFANRTNPSFVSSVQHPRTIRHKQEIKPQLVCVPFRAQVFLCSFRSCTSHPNSLLVTFGGTSWQQFPHSGTWLQVRKHRTHLPIVLLVRL